MDLFLMYKIKQLYAIHLTFEGKYLAFLTKLVLDAKASIGSTIK